MEKQFTYAPESKTIIWKTISWTEDVLISQTMQRRNAHPSFTVGRRTGSFARTSKKGKRLLAAIYSLVETAKANGLNIYAYLQHLLMYMPDTQWQQYPEDLDYLMPWNSDVQKQCK